MQYMKLPNGSQIEFYEYVMTNACIIRFVNGDYQKIKNFFGESTIQFFDVLDADGKIIESKSLGMRFSSINESKGTIKESEKKLISDAYDEEVTQPVVDENGEPVLDTDWNPQISVITVHHEAVYETVEKDVEVNMIMVILEVPSLEQQIAEIRSHFGMVDENALDLNGWKNYKQEENKLALKTFLENSSVEFGGKQYGVSEEDQNEMSLNYLQYQISTQAGQPAILEWHAKKEKCVTFTETEYAILVLMIKGFVYPFMSKMQTYKEQIYACTSIDEVKAISFDYRVEV